MKLKQKKKAKPLLSDKIADALTVKPRADIEDDQVFGTKPVTVSRADLSSSESENDATISDFRKRNVNLLSEISKKYEGQVITRKELDENTSDSEVESDSNVLQASGFQSKLASLTSKFTEADSDSENALSDTQKSKSQSGSEDFSSGAESEDYSIIKQQNNSDSEQSEEESDEDEGYDMSQMEEPVKEEFEHMKKQNVSEEAKKGASVRNQLLIWEGLLEMRIHLQRCVNTANQMPLPETREHIAGDMEFTEACTAATSNVANVLDKFMTLQSMLLKGFPETKTLCTKKLTAEAAAEKKEESDEEIPSDTDNEEIPSDTEDDENSPVKSPEKPDKNKEKPQKKRKLGDYESELATTHKAFKQFRDATIQKWNEKTRLTTATSIKNTPTNTILQQISYILSDRNKLIKRTQLKRSEYKIVGYKKQPSADDTNNTNGVENPVIRDRKDDDEYISEIFDDSDFYHQLLRELIECKSADISDPVQLSRQWIALQQMRSKMKRKVDTKATKGRKIKYVIHNQLVNYMAPEKCTSWTNESTNELYSSLFGKMFEYNNVGLNTNLENGLKIKD